MSLQPREPDHLTADQFMQDGDGQCWARVHTGDGWQWQRVSLETFKQAARALDAATAELRDITRSTG